MRGHEKIALGGDKIHGYMHGYGRTLRLLDRLLDYWADSVKITKLVSSWPDPNSKITKWLVVGPSLVKLLFCYLLALLWPFVQ